MTPAVLVRFAAESLTAAAAPASLNPLWPSLLILRNFEFTAEPSQQRRVLPIYQRQLRRAHLCRIVGKNRVVSDPQQQPRVVRSLSDVLPVGLLVLGHSLMGLQFERLCRAFELQKPVAPNYLRALDQLLDDGQVIAWVIFGLLHQAHQKTHVIGA